MARASAFAFLTLAEASLYAEHSGTHCYKGHGGTPLTAEDTAISDVTLFECEAACDNTTNCGAITLLLKKNDRWNPSGDCYLRSAVDLTRCDQSKQSSQWSTYTQVAPPPLTGVITYHLFEPKYTGLSNKDAGDFLGDASFIFGTFSKYSSGNPEASMDHNIIEMSEVNVTGWGTHLAEGMYEECNAPGATGFHVCPVGGDYCCTIHDPANHSHNIPTNHTRTQLPGLDRPHGSHLKGASGGFWFSFPRESRGVTWTEKTLRRIAGRCLGNAWRKDAGGCSQCGDALDQCVATCIQDALVPDSNVTLLKATWDRVFADPSECPEVPFPSDASIVV